jgi:hypothetical protein
VTVYPGVIIQNTGANPHTRYTADVHPNFNVTSINVTNNHIWLGTKYYDLTSVGNTANANITGFNEDVNFTLKQTGTLHTNTILTVHGLLQQVKLGNFFFPFGTHWRYVNSNTDTEIDAGVNTIVYGSFNTGPISPNSLILTGAIFGDVAQFDPPTIKINTPPSTNVTEIGLFNDTDFLYDHIFNPPIHVTGGVSTVLPWKFNDTESAGTQHYKVLALVRSGSTTTIVTSNTVTIYFGFFTTGSIPINQTNPISVPFRFVLTPINGTTSNLDVYYPSTYNSTCNLSYQNSLTNKTYSNLPVSHATFQFVNHERDVIHIDCLNTKGNQTGSYILTQSGFPLLKQIQDFRAGKFGTTGMFGAFDLVTLLALIMSIIGFNRVNESVGAVFNIGLIGALSFLGFISWPVILSSSIALLLVLIVSSTKKQPGGF